MNNVQAKVPDSTANALDEADSPTWLEVLAAVGQHRLLALLVFLLIVGLGGFYTFSLPRLYTS